MSTHRGLLLKKFGKNDVGTNNRLLALRKGRKRRGKAGRKNQASKSRAVGHSLGGKRPT